MVAKTSRRKIFVSCYKGDLAYKDQVLQWLGDDIVDKSVHEDDIDDANRKVETVRQIIRDDYIADASVTVVLVGPCTGRRKHVDWEIGSSLRDTPNNPRCGLLGILLPNHPNYGARAYNPQLVPPRLADNNGSGDAPYALVYDWPGRDSQAALRIRQWIDLAFKRRKGSSPHNGHLQFKRNRRFGVTRATRCGWR